jgi:RNA polymerase sigma factor (sigma-70 family)
MQAMDDMALLREYATRNSEAAFETLVSRRVNFVYSAALRQVRDPYLAEEVTQAVFIILAQKAGRISDKTILAGWLFRTTRFAALTQIRADAKRRLREQEAQMQSELQPSAPDLFWEQMSPLLDEALATLGETDRQAVLLRFFENKSLAEVGSHLGTGEDTARKRVARALEKLHRYFSKCGVSSTTAIIAGAISVNSVQGAPVALAKTVSAMAMAKGAAASGSTLTLINGALKIMAWTKAQTAIVAGTCVLLAAGTTTLIIQNANKPTPIQGIPKDWSILSGTDEQWNWTNNAIYGHSTTGDSILASTRQYGDVSVSAVVSTTNKEATLVLRMQDADNGYLAVFAPDGTPVTKVDRDTAKIVLIRRKAGEEKELAIFKRRKLSAPGQLETFTFTARGPQLDIRLNDLPILKTNDTTFTSGFIGLRVYGWGDFPCDGVFSNLTVR